MPPRQARRFATLLLVLPLVSQAASAEDTTPRDEPDHAGHPTEIVGITGSRLLPTVVVVPPDSAFGWINYSARDAAIEFDQDIRPKLRCRSPGAFSATGAALAAPRVASGGFVTLCSLAPGEYDYQVKLEGRPPFLGKLIVMAGD